MLVAKLEGCRNWPILYSLALHLQRRILISIFSGKLGSNLAQFSCIALFFQVLLRSSCCAWPVGFQWAFH